jgi:hypothetical protein
MGKKNPLLKYWKFNHQYRKDKMKITIPDTVLRNGEVVNISQDKEAEKKPTIISDTIPMLIQDENGIWVKNPEYREEGSEVKATVYKLNNN